MRRGYVAPYFSGMEVANTGRAGLVPTTSNQAFFVISLIKVPYAPSRERHYEQLLMRHARNTSMENPGWRGGDFGGCDRDRRPWGLEPSWRWPLAPGREGGEAGRTDSSVDRGRDERHEIPRDNIEGAGCSFLDQGAVFSPESMISFT